MARPRKIIHPADLVKIEDMAARGCGHVQIARAIGLDAKTLRLRLKDDEAAAASYADGKSEEEGALVSILRRKADQGSETAAMFLLKARHGYRDRGDDTTSMAPGVSVTISLPGPLDPATYAKLIEGVAVDVPAKAIAEPVDGR